MQRTCKAGRYAQRGVSSAKEDVHNAIKNVDKGLYPEAFCKIVPDYLGGDDEYCIVMHADGAGTKSSLAYIYERNRRYECLGWYCARCNSNEYR